MSAVGTLRAMAEDATSKGNLNTARNFAKAAEGGEAKAAAYLRMVRLVGGAAKSIVDNASQQESD